MKIEKKPKAIYSKTIYVNNYVRILVDTLKIDGNQWEQAYFVKPNKNSVGVLPIDEGGLYLVRQFRHASRSFLWQIIGGMVEEGDSEIDTAKKELREEAGITAKHFQKIGMFIAEPGMSPQETSVYVGTNLKFEKNHPSHQEVGIKIKYFPFKKIKDMIKRGDIKCGFTLSSLLLLKNNYFPQ